MSKGNTDETPACCCIDVGIIMDNSGCTVCQSRRCASRAEAEQALATLTEKACAIASEPCKIIPVFKEVDGDTQLDIDFVFCCEAEAMIFQFALRSLSP